MEVGSPGKFPANTKKVIVHVYRVFSFFKGLQSEHMRVDLHKNKKIPIPDMKTTPDPMCPISTLEKEGERRVLEFYKGNVA